MVFVTDLLRLWKIPFCLTEIYNYSWSFKALNHTTYNCTFSIYILIINNIPFCFLNLLNYHLFGSLSSYSSQIRKVYFLFPLHCSYLSRHSVNLNRNRLVGFQMFSRSRFQSGFYTLEHNVFVDISVLM